MIVKLLTEHHLEFLSLKGGCRGSSESKNVKMQHCWKSHATAHISCECAFILQINKYNFKKSDLSYIIKRLSSLHRPKKITKLTFKIHVSMPYNHNGKIS